MHGRVSRTAPDSIETLFLEIAVPSRAAVSLNQDGPNRRKNSGGEMPAANGRLIEGGTCIVNAGKRFAAGPNIVCYAPEGTRLD